MEENLILINSPLLNACSLVILPHQDNCFFSPIFCGQLLLLPTSLPKSSRRRRRDIRKQIKPTPYINLHFSVPPKPRIETERDPEILSNKQTRMEVISRASIAMAAAICLILATAFPAAMANVDVPAPAPSPASDGTAIDQGIAYVLMLLALVLTYIIH